MKIFRIRLFLVLSLFIAVSSVLGVRLWYLFTIQKKFLEQQGDARTVRTVTIPAYRGMILDRYEQPLAVSTAVATVWMNPAIISKDNNLEHYDYNQLAKILELPKDVIKNKALENKHKEFVYVKRQIVPDLAETIEKLKLPGIFIKKEFKRYYPNSEVTAHITGFTSIDEVGQEGVEHLLENNLQGKPGRQQVLKDRLGRVVKTIKQDVVAKPGENVVLSIDLRLQYLAYKSLKEAIAKHAAKAGIAVILDISNGEILALANQPSFNPNDRIALAPNELRNRAVTDLFEPGSLLKPISMAAALSTGKFKENFVVDTNPGYIKVGTNVVRDLHNYGELDLKGIIKKSSNIGITKLTLASDPSNLINLLYDLGFGEPTSAYMLGEAGGWINPVKPSEEFKLSTLSFGYGIAATPLQLIQAYSVLGNHGKFIPITIFKHNNDDLNTSKKPKQIMSSKVADQVLTMLNAVMQPDGTGRSAMIPNYESAGKSGTTRKLTENGYDETKHNSLFIGMAPYPNPRLAMLVFIIEPTKNDYYGGAVAGPVFRDVISRALQLYGISPNVDV